jgi:hypothetical protein
MDINFTNFHEEHQKQKEKLAFLDNVLERVGQLRDEEIKLGQTQSEIHTLCNKLEALEALEECLVRLRTKHKQEESDHEAEKAAWKEKSGNTPTFIFGFNSPSPSSDPDCDNLEELKVAVELARLNSVLFEQKLGLINQKKAISKLEEELKEVGQDFVTKLDSITAIESNTGARETALRDAKLDWARMRIRSVAEAHELSTAKERICNLKSTIKEKDAIIDRHISELASANRVIEAKAEVLDTWRPLTLAGIQLRSRILQWKEENPTHQVVPGVDRSSDRSMALADATLYQSFSLIPPRTDVDTFKSLYGIAPEFLWKFRHCQKFVDFIDCCADLKHFRADPTGQGLFPSTKAQMWAAGILTDMGHSPGYFSARRLNEYFEDGNKRLGKYFYEELKN